MTPPLAKIAIKQVTAPLSEAVVDRLDDLLLFVADGTEKWSQLPYGELLRARLQRRAGEAEAGQLITQLPNRRGTRVALGIVKPGMSSFELLSLARKLAGPLLEDRPDTMAVVVFGMDEDRGALAVGSAVAALHAGSFTLPSFKSRVRPSSRFSRIDIYGLSARRDWRRVTAEAEANNLARWLTALPGSHLTPSDYRREIEQLSRRQGWRLRFLGLAQLRRLKAGAFLAVAEGGPQPDAGVIHLRYEPTGRAARQPAIALVGKGICFDTGGINLKPAKFMFGMHEDMAGSATALGTLLALTTLQVPFPVDCWLAVAQNFPGPRAYKPNDVVAACNGTTIEIVHTDAEGRMVLADTLALAGRAQPRLIIDYATLTGACIHALSTRYSGAFTNQDAWLPKIIAAGKASGERVWPFPLDEDFDKELESDVADVKQCTLGNDADHIYAARFLQRFVGETPWLHLDLAAGNHKGGLAHIPTDVTGFGIRYTLSLLLDQQL